MPKNTQSATNRAADSTANTAASEETRAAGSYSTKDHAQNTNAVNNASVPTMPDAADALFDLQQDNLPQIDLDDETIDQLLQTEILDGRIDLGRMLATRLTMTELREDTKIADLALHLLKQKFPTELGTEHSLYEHLFTEDSIEDDKTTDNQAPTAKDVEDIIRTRGLKMTDLSSPDMLAAVAEYLSIKHPELDLDIEPNLCDRLFTGEWADKLDAALNAPPVKREPKNPPKA